MAETRLQLQPSMQYNSCVEQTPTILKYTQDNVVRKKIKPTLSVGYYRVFCHGHDNTQPV